MKQPKKVQTTLFGLVLLIAAAALVYSREADSEYLGPLQPVARGRAPGMQVQLLSDESPNRLYAVIFRQGDDPFSGLLDFADKFHVTTAHFTAIGAVNGATLAWFAPQRKMYRKVPVNGQVEVLSMVGNI